MTNVAEPLPAPLPEPLPAPPFEAPVGGIIDPLREVVSADNFTPRLLALISNALVWRESFLMRSEFDLGTNDWRVLSALAIHPGATATFVSGFLILNKAVVSKAVTTLIARNLIISTGGPRGSRHLFLTAAGAQMHDKMLPISLKGEEIILGDLDSAEILQLNALLTRMLAQTGELLPTNESPDAHASL